MRRRGEQVQGEPERLTPRVAGAVAVLARVVVAAAGGYAAGARQRGDSPAQVDHTPGEIQATL